MGHSPLVSHSAMLEWSNGAGESQLLSLDHAWEKDGNVAFWGACAGWAAIAWDCAEGGDSCGGRAEEGPWIGYSP